MEGRSDERGAVEGSADGGLAHSIADYAASLDGAPLPAELVGLARRAVADYVGCALAGSASEPAVIAAAWVESLGGAPDASIHGTALRAPAPLAALANGVAAHALDLDDYSTAMTHPTVCVAPAVLALGERSGASGERLLSAYAAGAETTVQLAALLNPEHYRRGWHATATTGLVGAALASAKLLGLDREATASALGIAASSAAGLRENFGSMVKPLHAGNAALHGVTAAELAARGFSAAPGALGAMVEVLGGSEPSEDAFVPGRFELLDSGLVFKRFACCGAIHAALDALLDLRARHGLDPSAVSAIECEVNSWAPRILVHSSPRSADEGRFSLEYSLAVALADGDAGLAQYTDARFGDPQLQALAARVAVSVDESLPVRPGRFPATVTVVARDGSRHSQAVDEPRGFPSNPLGATELEAKLREFAATKLPADRVDVLARLLAGTEAMPGATAICEAAAC